MGIIPDAILYRLLIDPLLSSLHNTVIEYVGTIPEVIDVACGAGTLSMNLAKKARHVTAVDISETMIDSARKLSARKGLQNIEFLIRDAVDLADFSDNQFDAAVTSMSIHQFDPELAIKVLQGMKRIARDVIIADYNHMMPRGFAAGMAWTIEKIAGGNHYRYFRNYMEKGGITWFAETAGLKIVSEKPSGRNVFMIVLCRP